MNKQYKCDTCFVTANVAKSKEPAACKWFIDNVVCGNKSVNDCPMYKHKDDKKK